jgi:hypothetical protein
MTKLRKVAACACAASLLAGFAVSSQALSLQSAALPKESRHVRQVSFDRATRSDLAIRRGAQLHRALD